MTAPQDPFAAPGDQPPVPGQQPPAPGYGPPPVYGTPPGYPPPYGAPQGYPPPYGQVPAPQGTNTLAIVGFILTFVVCPPVGAVLCYIALGQIKRTGEGGRGLALAGVWIGIITVVLAVLIVLALFTFGAAVEGTFQETVVPLPSPGS